MGLTETTFLQARAVGDVRELPALERDAVARIDETDGATVAALTRELLRRGHRLAAIRRGLTRMVRCGQLSSS